MFKYLPSTLLSKMFFIGSGFLMVYILLQQIKLIDSYMHRERYALLDSSESVTIEPNRTEDVIKQKVEFFVTNMVNAFFSRSPYEIDTPVLKDFLFTPNMKEQIVDYIDSTSQEYKSDDLHEKAEIQSINAIHKNDTEIIVSCKGQVIRISSQSESQSLEGFEFDARFSISRITNISEVKMFPYKCHKFFIKVFSDNKLLFTIGVPYEEA